MYNYIHTYWYDEYTCMNVYSIDLLSMYVYTYFVCLDIWLIYTYSICRHQEIPSQNLENRFSDGAANSSKILCEDLLNATDLALVLIFRWAAFLPFCHASLREPVAPQGSDFCTQLDESLSQNTVMPSRSSAIFSMKSSQATWTYRVLKSLASTILDLILLMVARKPKSRF